MYIQTDLKKKLQVRPGTKKGRESCHTECIPKELGAQIKQIIHGCIKPIYIHTHIYTFIYTHTDVYVHTCSPSSMRIYSPSSGSSQHTFRECIP